MASLTVENYLKAILQITMRKRTPSVTTGELAAALQVLPGTVTSMLKALDESRLATYTPYEGAVLTEAGRKLAMRMLRRHRLIELFLAQTLHLPWDQVHEEAEHMEHAVSDRLVDRMDEFLGEPAYDPHGDPIPAADGELRGELHRAIPLSDCQAGARARFVRVLDQGAEFLRFLSESGFELGSTGTVSSNSIESGIVQVTIGPRVLNLGHTAAARILVELDAE